MKIQIPEDCRISSPRYKNHGELSLTLPCTGSSALLHSRCRCGVSYSLGFRFGDLDLLLDMLYLFGFGAVHYSFLKAVAEHIQDIFLDRRIVSLEGKRHLASAVCSLDFMIITQIITTFHRNYCYWYYLIIFRQEAMK